MLVRKCFQTKNLFCTCLSTQRFLSIQASRSAPAPEPGLVDGVQLPAQARVVILPLKLSYMCFPKHENDIKKKVKNWTTCHQTNPHHICIYLNSTTPFQQVWNHRSVHTAWIFTLWRIQHNEVKEVKSGESLISFNLCLMHSLWWGRKHTLCKSQAGRDWVWETVLFWNWRLVIQSLEINWLLV